jgi:hypothetical protein
MRTLGRYFAFFVIGDLVMAGFAVVGTLVIAIPYFYIDALWQAGLYTLHGPISSPSTMSIG